MRWPRSARHLYEEKHPIDPNEEDDREWTRLTPFKVSMEHQKAIVEAQLEVAIEMGVNVSFHSVSAAGTSMIPPSGTRLTQLTPFQDQPWTF